MPPTSLLMLQKNILSVPSSRLSPREFVNISFSFSSFSDEMGNVNKQIEDAIPQEFDVGAKVNVNKDFTYDTDDDGNPKKPKPKGGGAAGGFIQTSCNLSHA